MIIRAKFSKPLDISQSYEPDQFKVFVIDNQLIKSKTSGFFLSNITDDTTMSEVIPKQLSEGVSITTLKDVSKNVKVVMNTILYLQIGFQFLLKAVMNDLW